MLAPHAQEQNFYVKNIIKENLLDPFTATFLIAVGSFRFKDTGAA
jgi:hypothetical protein